MLRKHAPAHAPQPRRWFGRSKRLTVIAGAAVAATVVSVLPILAGEAKGLILQPFADTTLSQVPQDGNNAVKTTLASCPAVCEGNPRARRDAVLQFAVHQLPANAVRVKATLRVYAWKNFTAQIVARTVRGDLKAVSSAARLASASTVPAIKKVSKGYNDFDVSGTVQQNGTYTVTLSQQSLNTRVYWASRENAKKSLHPELVLRYETTQGTPPAKPSASTTGVPPATATPTPSVKPTTKPPASKPPTTKPTTTPTTTTTPTPAEPAGWRLVWSDEFNGGSVDRSKWNLHNNEGRDIDIGCNTDSPENTFVGGGNLTLRALRETAVCSSQTRQYTQGYLDTIGKASWPYGRFEMRAKSPNKPATSAGLWPAFWLRPDDGGNGEIDVTELPGGADWYSKSTAAIFYDYSPVKQDIRLGLPTGGYPGDGFHTYATEWDATSMRWYLDGKLVWTRDRGTTSWYDQAFHKPYNLRLNFQVGGWLGDPDASTAFPADFVVDYVRVYQH